jgi:hypothetical protein
MILRCNRQLKGRSEPFPGCIIVGLIEQCLYTYCTVSVLKLYSRCTVSVQKIGLWGCPLQIHIYAKNI